MGLAAVIAAALLLGACSGRDQELSEKLARTEAAAKRAEAAASRAEAAAKQAGAQPAPQPEVVEAEPEVLDTEPDVPSVEQPDEPAPTTRG